MGAFDPGTQRRTRNVSSARILPAAEVLPHCAPGGLPGLADQLTALAEKLAKKQKTEAIVQTLREDAERLRSGAAPGAADRYLAAIYPTVTAGVHYLPPNAVVFLSESGRVDERVKNTVLQQKQDVEALLSAGVLAGEYAHLTLTAEELYAALEDFPVILEDSLPTSRHPLRPRGLPDHECKAAQLLRRQPGDRRHGSGALPLLRQRGAGALRWGDPGEESPPAAGGEGHPGHPGSKRRRHACGGGGAPLPGGPVRRQRVAGAEAGGADRGPADGPGHAQAPAGEEGLQPAEAPVLHRPVPGDLVVHEHHGVGRFVGIQRMPVDGVEKDYIKIDYAGGDCLYVPVTQLDLVSKYIGGGEDTERTKLNKLGAPSGPGRKPRPRRPPRIWPGASSRCMPSGRSGRASPSPRTPLAAGI